MTHIEITDTISYTESLKLFTMSEVDLKFDTSYRIWNPITNYGKVFNFTESTGSEFDKNTKYIYKSDDGYTLEVSNDEEITKKRSKQYLESKT